jgi:hypothetical protein
MSYKREIEKGRYIPNPEWESSDECKDEVAQACAAVNIGSKRLGAGLEEYMSYYPQEFGLGLPETGGWVIVKHPPHCEYTVPPMSIWFALNWQMDVGVRSGVHPKRIKIVTPLGDLGLFPHEYALAKDIRSYIGREADGVIFHRLDGSPALPAESLFYIQSRGIKRAEACMMLLDKITDPSFGWFEIAPAYGEYFGEDWPTPERCPFATPLNMWNEEKACAKSDRA